MLCQLVTVLVPVVEFWAAGLAASSSAVLDTGANNHTNFKGPNRGLSGTPRYSTGEWYRKLLEGASGMLQRYSERSEEFTLTFQNSSTFSAKILAAVLLAGCVDRQNSP